MSQQRDRQTGDSKGTISPADAIKDFGSMTVRHVGGSQYVVTNMRTGGTYEVDLREISCTCEDMEYNRDDNESCKHYLMAHYQADNVRMSVEDRLTQDMARMLIETGDLIREMEDTADALEGALITTRDAEAGGELENGTDSSHDPEPPGQDIDVKAASDRLKEAYDEVVEDMRTQAHKGYVWVQTGRDTPDQLPGPGNVEPFTAFLQAPEQVEYIYDDHDDAGQKPGQYWSNRIAPEAVDEYIEEVLQ
jgi:hypothetical protein